jgi:ferric-dicitrate binding protein FerR (iron transport regulator)
VQLESGGGDFNVQPDQPSFRVETDLGIVTTSGGQFSLEFMTTLPEHVSSTVSLQLPRLVVVVAQGSVTVEQTGRTTRLSAGEEHVFL